ncbi:MAG: hypothetical protein A2Y17_05280 [Clostridiales bacterium GWF2_38_85]|nr:MAG: hypothetical protein A2Y17_05280 [Clostridiales bacterium GWF2_38_85]HBL83358.1 hypothetical protein [Clostridiales bacterium]
MNTNTNTKENTAKDNPVKSIIKAFGLLDIFIFEDLERKGIGLVELSKQVGIKPNTLHNILKSMIKCGYVVQNSEGKYAAGLKCAKISMVNKLISQKLLYDVLLPRLKVLRKAIDENVTFAVLSNGKRYGIFSLEADKPVKAVAEKNNSSIYSVVTGISLAVYADDEELQKIIEAYGYPQGICNIEELKAMLAKKQKELYYTALQHNDELETFGVSVILTSDGTRIVCSAGVYMPAYRCNDELRQKIINELLQLKTDLERVDLY